MVAGARGFMRGGTDPPGRVPGPPHPERNFPGQEGRGFTRVWRRQAGA